MATGYLNEDSDLREIFKDGIVPLRSPVADRGTAKGGRFDGQEIIVYEVDIDRMTEEQIDLMLERFGKRMGRRVSLDEVRPEGYRIRRDHFSSIGFDARLIG